MSKEGSGDEQVGPQDAAADNAPTKDPNADIYENRGPKKIIRVVTVIAYLFSVSFVGIVLSAYYLFLWEPPRQRLIESDRLRAEPKVHFLFAAPPPDLREGGDLLQTSDLDRADDLTPPDLAGRVAPDVPDVDPGEIARARSRPEWLNAMLLKLRRWIVRTTLRARNSSEAIAASGNDTYDGTVGVLNSTGIADVRESENAPSAEYNGSETSRGNVVSGEESRSGAPIVERESESRDRTRRLDAVVAGANFNRSGSDNAPTNDSSRAFEDDSASASTIREYGPETRVGILDDGKMPTDENKTVGERRTIVNDGAAGPSERNGGAYTIAASEGRVADARTSRFPPTNTGVNGPGRNYFGDGDGDDSANGQTTIERIARRVQASIEDSPRESGRTDVPGGSSHRSPDDAIVKRSYAARNPEGERTRISAPRDFPALPRRAFARDKTRPARDYTI